MLNKQYGSLVNKSINSLDYLRVEQKGFYNTSNCPLPLQACSPPGWRTFPLLVWKELFQCDSVFFSNLFCFTFLIQLFKVGAETLGHFFSGFSLTISVWVTQFSCFEGEMLLGQCSGEEWIKIHKWMFQIIIVTYIHLQLTFSVNIFYKINTLLLLFYIY